MSPDTLALSWSGLEQAAGPEPEGLARGLGGGGGVSFLSFIFWHLFFHRGCCVLTQSWGGDSGWKFRSAVP